jgi:hypothetical protein
MARRPIAGLYGDADFVDGVREPAPTALDTFYPQPLSGSGWARGPVVPCGIPNRRSSGAGTGLSGRGGYLEFHKIRWPGGLKLWRVTGADVDLGGKEPYDPNVARARAHTHARDYASLLGAIDRTVRPAGGEVIATPFDTELFGHWWFEGVDFIGDLYRDLGGMEAVRPVTASQHLDGRTEGRNDGRRIELAEGSWGANGDFSKWMNPETQWTWDRLWNLEDRFWDLMRREPSVVPSFRPSRPASGARTPLAQSPTGSSSSRPAPRRTMRRSGSPGIATRSGPARRHHGGDSADGALLEHGARDDSSPTSATPFARDLAPGVMPSPALVVHAHLYQPPREDPRTGEFPVEPGAAPFHDWNEKITAECYRPIAPLLGRMSFNVGATLFEWLDAKAPGVGGAFVDADRESRARLGQGAAMAMPYHHIILRWHHAGTRKSRCAGASAIFSAASSARRRGCGCPRRLSTSRHSTCWRPPVSGSRCSHRTSSNRRRRSDRLRRSEPPPAA